MTHLRPTATIRAVVFPLLFRSEDKTMFVELLVAIVIALVFVIPCVVLYINARNELDFVQKPRRER